MASFGKMLRVFRRQCRDSLRGGLLTQERLGELLGHELGEAGYSGAAVSDWERDKSKIDEDQRLVLVALVKILHEQGGLGDPGEANELLRAGNYRGLNAVEHARIFPTAPLESERAGAAAIGSRPTAAAQLAGSPLERRKQLILLEKVNSFWVKGVLEKTATEALDLLISHRRYDEAIEHPWRKVMGGAVSTAEIEESTAKAIDVFTNLDRALLILGAAGSGKTTTLLTLARDLIAVAQNNPVEPIPVVLSLVSWAQHRGSLGAWCIEELAAKYQIPHRTGTQWLDNSELLLLLDGFDEVPASLRPACAAAINDFRETHGLNGIAICSRTKAYEECDVQLRLGGAIHLQPLKREQIEYSLRQAERRLASLRRVLQQDAVLQEAARSPLMLNVMHVAYRDASVAALTIADGEGAGGEGETSHRRTHLFNTYVERMFQRRYANPDYAPEQTKRWLAWLAKRMTENNQSVFYIEEMQPSWLGDRRSRWLYLLLSRLVAGLMGGIVMWLLLQFYRQIEVAVPSGFSAFAATVFGIPPVAGELMAVIGGNLLLALLITVVTGLYFERWPDRGQHNASASGRHWSLALVIGLIAGAATFGVVVFFDGFWWALAWAVAEALLYVVFSRFVHGHSFRSEVTTVASLGWSWESAAYGLSLGLVLAAVAEIIESSLYGYNGILEAVLTFGLGGALLGGLRGRRVDPSARPNQGIRMSIRNGFVAGIVIATTLGLLTWLLRDGPMALIIASAMVVLTVPLYGGGNVSKHFLLRLLLWRQGHIPRNYIHFLDHAVGLVFLRRVGSGYIFIHHMLLEHFAGMKSPAAS